MYDLHSYTYFYSVTRVMLRDERRDPDSSSRVIRFKKIIKSINFLKESYFIVRGKEKN